MLSRFHVIPERNGQTWIYIIDIFVPTLHIKHLIHRPIGLDEGDK